MCKRSEARENGGWSSVSPASWILSLVENVPICHVISVLLSQLYRCLLFGLFWAVGFTRVLEAYIVLIALKCTFCKHPAFEATYASYLRLCDAQGFLPVIDCMARQSLVHDLISLLGPCVPLGIHWIWSNVSSSLRKKKHVASVQQTWACQIPLEAWQSTFFGGWGGWHGHDLSQKPCVFHIWGPALFAQTATHQSHDTLYRCTIRQYHSLTETGSSFTDPTHNYRFRPLKPGYLLTLGCAQHRLSAGVKCYPTANELMWEIQRQWVIVKLKRKATLTQHNKKVFYYRGGK